MPPTPPCALWKHQWPRLPQALSCLHELSFVTRHSIGLLRIHHPNHTLLLHLREIAVVVSRLKVASLPLSDFPLAVPLFMEYGIILLCIKLDNLFSYNSYARRWSKKYGVDYFEAEGPCHQVLGENGYDLPGTLLVGTDSHTCTSGAFGCFGTGVGSTEAAGLLHTGTIWLRVPESILITIL